MTYDKKKIDKEIAELKTLMNIKTIDQIENDYKYHDLKIKLMLLECANEIAGKLKDVL